MQAGPNKTTQERFYTLLSDFINKDEKKRETANADLQSALSTIIRGLATDEYLDLLDTIKFQGEDLTPLQICCLLNLQEIVKALLEQPKYKIHYLDIEAKSPNTNKTALNYLQEKQAYSLVKQLKFNFQFPFRYEGKDLVDTQERTLSFTKALEGRGQSKPAGFYQSSTGDEFLMKEDNPATCMFEGTAQYVKKAKVLPRDLEASVNYADIAVLDSPEGPKVASIQDRVTSSLDGHVEPWDKLVYGHKRNPVMGGANELVNAYKIKENIDNLPLDVKWELAATLLASALAGDESLHPGQFMALLDKENKIIGIERVDLGARERYAVARSLKNQTNPYETSSFYKGWQFGAKDNIGYLLAEPMLERLYTMLWVHVNSQGSFETLKEQSQQLWIEAFDSLPESIREEALNNVLETINKGLSENEQVKMIVKGDKVSYIAQRIAELDAKRAKNMSQQAVEKFNKSFETDEVRTLATKILSTTASNVDYEKGLKLLKEIDSQISVSTKNGNFESTERACKTAIELQSAIYFYERYLTSPSIANEKATEQSLKRLQSISELAVYAKTRDPKKPVLKELINAALESEAALSELVQTPRIRNTLDDARFISGEGKKLLDSLERRYPLRSARPKP